MAGLEGKLTVTRKQNALLIVFPSCLKAIDEACKTARAFLISNEPALSSQWFALNLLIREALTNAVCHGNKNDPDAQVVFDFVWENSRVCMRIQDQGRGFDWKKQQAAKCLETSNHGRGIPIMEIYATRYSYNDKGNVLHIQKDLI